MTSLNSGTVVITSTSGCCAATIAAVAAASDSYHSVMKSQFRMTHATLSPMHGALGVGLESRCARESHQSSITSKANSWDENACKADVLVTAIASGFCTAIMAAMASPKESYQSVLTLHFCITHANLGLCGVAITTSIVSTMLQRTRLHRCICTHARKLDLDTMDDWERKMRKAHGGWCYTDKGQVVTAIARGPNHNKVQNVLDHAGQHVAHSMVRDGMQPADAYTCQYIAAVANGPISKAQSNAFGLATKETTRSVLLNQRVQLLTDFTVYVTCPSSAVALRTLCRVEGHMLKLAMYYVIEGKVISRINQDLGDHIDTATYCNRMNSSADDLVFKPNQFSIVEMLAKDDVRHTMDRFTTMESIIAAYHTWLEMHLLRGVPQNDHQSARKLIAARCTKIAMCAAGCMLACVVQYYAAMDGGTTFRDGRGRTQTSDEYDNSIRIFLFQ